MFDDPETAQVAQATVLADHIIHYPETRAANLAKLEEMATTNDRVLYILGVLFTGAALGHSIPELTDHPRALACFEKADFPLAKMNLAVMLSYGLGAPKDRLRAKAIFAGLARRERNGAAMLNLALMYRDGDPMPHSQARYYKWLCRAHLHGSKKAADYLERDFQKVAWEVQVIPFTTAKRLHRGH